MIRKIIPESSIDYKGKFCSIIFISGCNFRCGFCHNPELISNSEIPDSEKEDIAKKIEDIILKAKKGWINGVCITGGEPCLYPDLENLCKKLKELNLAVKIDTNGTNPKIIKDLLDKKLIDYVALDIKSDMENYEKMVNSNVDLKKIEETIRILANLDKDRFELRTTIAPFFANELRFLNLSEIEKMAKWVSDLIKRKDVYYYIQKFVSRDKDILDERLRKDNIPKDMVETPQDLLIEIEKLLKGYFDYVEVR